MKKKTFPALRPPDAAFEPRLRAYSTLSGVALVAAGNATLVTATLVTTTPAYAQAVIHNITNSSGIGGLLALAYSLAADSLHATVTIGGVNATFEILARGGYENGVYFLRMGGVDGLLVPVPPPFSHDFLGKLDLHAPIGPGSGLGAGQYWRYAGTEAGGRLFSTGAHGLAFRRGEFQAHASGRVTGYVGFRKMVGSRDYYGWLRVQVAANFDGHPRFVTFVPKAGTTDIYGAYALGGIQAGDVFTAIPEPASVATGLALFALGAAGVREYRRRRQLAA